MIINKNILVVGGTDGIGRALAEQLVIQNKVLIAGRSTEKGRSFTDSSANAYFIAADVSVLKNVKGITTEIKKHFNRLDFIIHTADVLWTMRVDTNEGLETSIAINYYSRVLFNHYLMNTEPRFTPKRIIHVAAAGYPFNKKMKKFFPVPQTTSGFKSHGYGQMANDFYGLFMAPLLKERGTSINILNPGIVDTNIRRNGRFPKIFKVIEPVVGWLLKGSTKSPAVYAQSIVSILSNENEAASNFVLINAKGKGIKGNAVANDRSFQEHVREQTIRTLESITGEKINDL